MNRKFIKKQTFQTDVKGAIGCTMMGVIDGSVSESDCCSRKGNIYTFFDGKIKQKKYSHYAFLHIATFCTFKMNFLGI